MTNEKRLRTLDEHIADSLRESERSGEMAKARDFGKPLHFGDGYDETPAELRMAFKVLKDAGYAPPEVAMMRELSEGRAQLAALDPDSAEAEALRKKLLELELSVSLRLEKLGSLKP